MAVWPRSILMNIGAMSSGSVTLTVAATESTVPHCITSPTQPRHVCPGEMLPVAIIVSDGFFTHQICGIHSLPGHLHVLNVSVF